MQIMLIPIILRKLHRSQTEVVFRQPLIRLHRTHRAETRIATALRKKEVAVQKQKE
jgi:hypothetical protein